MVPALSLRRTKTISILVLAAATILVALWLGPRGSRGGPVPPPPPVGDPCAVAIGGRLTSTHVLVGSRDEHLAITLRAPACGERTTRPPMSITLVIDRSGSMSGEPIMEARRAARRLVDLLEPTDAFAIVTYSTGAELVMPMTRATEDAKYQAHRAIDAIDSDGGTNISAGLELGKEQVLTTPIRDGVRRVVLISDGQANEGVYDRAGLARIAATTAAGGVSISTVGVGLDFDEVTMTDIAAAGRGNYYFLEDSAQLAEMFHAELGAAGKTVAADAELALVPAPGVEILEVYGYGARRNGTGWIVPVADLAAGEQRKIVARVRLNATARGSLELATAELTYRPIDAHQRRVVTTTAHAEVTGDAKVVRAGVDTGIARQIEEAQTAAAIEQANIAYEKEGYDSARRVLDQRMQAANANAMRYGDGLIAESSGKATSQVLGDFAAAPAADAPEGRGAKKRANKAAFELAK